MLPTIEIAEKLLEEGVVCNPGPWGRHSRLVAECARRIAQACGDLNPERAYIVGLLHDIGRKFGVRHMGHIYDGYTYMKELGFDEAAKVCLTHSFCIKRIEDYIGRVDVTEEELKVVTDALAAAEYDDYDRLIQLCDSLAGGESIMNIEDRMNDVKRRYGSFPQDKWDKNLELKAYFEGKTGEDIYQIIGYAEKRE